MRSPLAIAAVVGIAAAHTVFAQAPGPGQPGFAPALEPAAYLGILVNPLEEQETATLALPPGIGLKIVYIDPQSKAAAVLKENDVLQKMDDQMLVNMEQLVVISRLHKGGESVTFSLLRDGKPAEASVELVEKELPVLSRSSFGSFRAYFASGVDRDVAMEVMRKLSAGMRGPGGPDAGGRDGRRGRGFSRGPDRGPGGERTPGDGGNPPPDGPSAGGRSMTKTRTADGGSTTTMSGEKHILTLVVEPAGGRTLLVTDLDGKQVFAGPVNTPEEKSAVPEDIRPLFDEMDRR